jgi:ADP-ribose pyrophosphatase YjhB (NUDIX family)
MINKVSAGGIVYKKINNDYLFLLVKNKVHGHWGFPKGIVGDKVKNEDLEEAAQREVLEEGGVKTKIISKINKPVRYRYSQGSNIISKVVWLFLMEYISGNPNNHDNEISEAQFFTANKAEEVITFEEEKHVFQEALKILK